MAQKKLIVIGGGAAGFFCAVNAARLNSKLEVVVVEKHNKILSKVRVSGGGRCNVTHSCFDLQELVKKYPRGQNFLKKSFHWFNTQHTIDWFEERGVNLATEADGRMFPVTNTSQTIVDCLMKETNKYGVRISYSTEIIEIKLTDSVFELLTNSNQVIQADFICIACGGYPKSTQFEWLQKIGHHIETPVPSLFTFNVPQHPILQLMGVSVESAQIKIAGTKLSNEGPLLITHWGFSGPAVLKLSAYAARVLAEKNYDFTILINWLKGYNEHSLRDEWIHLRERFAAQKVHSKNPFQLPNRLWGFLLQQSDIKEQQRWADISVKQQNQLIKLLTVYEFQVKGKTTFKEEFVTCGGIQLGEVDANTMQSKKMPNLFFAGEILDVDGITGGFNFQNAWTTGWLAANTIASL
jgi:predicted Rossmann fold flavoprotein